MLEAKEILPVPTAGFSAAGNMEGIFVKGFTGLQRGRHRNLWRCNGTYAGTLRVTARFPSFLKQCCPIAVSF